MPSRVEKVSRGEFLALVDAMVAMDLPSEFDAKAVARWVAVHDAVQEGVRSSYAANAGANRNCYTPEQKRRIAHIADMVWERLGPREVDLIIEGRLPDD